jgi:hypothetical protein
MGSLGVIMRAEELPCGHGATDVVHDVSFTGGGPAVRAGPERGRKTATEHAIRRSTA